MHEQLTERLPPSLPFHAGHLGVLASIAAFEHGGEWLDALVAHLDRNRALLADLLQRAASGGGLRARRRPATSRGSIAASSVSASDPAEAFLERGRVALSRGPSFGEPGKGYARLNFGTSSALLEEAVRRMALDPLAVRLREAARAEERDDGPGEEDDRGDQSARRGGRSRRTPRRRRGSCRGSQGSERLRGDDGVRQDREAPRSPAARRA